MTLGRQASGVRLGTSSPTETKRRGASSRRKGGYDEALMTVEDAGMLWRSFGGTSFGAPMRLLEMAGRIGDDELLVYAYCEAASDHLKGYWFTEKIARERIARIRETLREAEKKLERDDSPRARRGMRSVADILAKEIALTCSRVSGGRLVTPARHDKAKATSTAQITTGTAGRLSR